MSTSSIALSRKAVVLGRVADYAELTRPKIALLIVATAVVAQFAASEGDFLTGRLAGLAVGVLLVAASASALNQWLERRTDALMARTENRPVPSGRIGGLEVRLFAGASLVAGEVCLATTVSVGSAVWAALTWAAYVWCYTPLKSRTWWNTVVGAVAGAMPVFIGWSLAGQSPLTDPRAIALFGLVFFWQFPHFMAIAWIYRQDYSEAGLKMLTVVDPTGQRAGVLSVVTAAVVMIVGMAPVCFGVGAIAPAGTPAWRAAGIAAALILGLGQLFCAAAFCRNRDNRCARRLLHASLVYLPAMLGLFLLFS